MHSSDLRHLHASRIFHAIRLHPHMSQREIADVAGADKSTVSAIIRDFEADGLIERSLGRANKRPGRPGERIRLSPRAGLLIGVHPRPDGLRYVVAGLDGAPLGCLSRAVPDPALLGSEIAAGIAAVTASVSMPASDVRAVGVCLPGLVSRDGMLTQSPNLGWKNLPVWSALHDQVPFPVYIDNNANAAAVAEYLFGRGTGTGDFAYVESGSGVGAGLFLNESLYRGAVGFAGEFGHTKVVPQGRACRCGALGCLSAYASDYSIQQRLAQKGVDAPGRDAITDLARSGDAVTLSVLQEAGRHLGLGLANLVNLLNLRLFILGGGFAAFAPFLLPAVREAMAENALPSAYADCRIEPSRIGSWEQPLGGVALALEGCTSHTGADAAPWSRDVVGAAA